jgi:hypothetical protein
MHSRVAALARDGVVLGVLDSGIEDKVHPYEVKDISVVPEIIFHRPFRVDIPHISAELFIYIAENSLLAVCRVRIDASAHHRIAVEV